MVLETRLPHLWRRGKVRDMYDLGEYALIVATDRVSVFDVVLDVGIPDKGRVLNGLSAWWFERCAEVLPNHFVALVDTLDVLRRHWPGGDLPEHADELIGRSMVVRKAEPLTVECIMRGYLTGSAWDEYRKTGTIAGVPYAGLQRSDRLPEPLFTPTTKAPQGEHDEPVSYAEMASLVGGADLAERVEGALRRMFRAGSEIARARGLLLADSKLEFGLIDGELLVIDELFTPDSSRFWDAEAWRPGAAMEPFDKQFLRDYLSGTGWDRELPAPEIPADVVEQTAERYREVYRRLTGEALR